MDSKKIMKLFKDDFYYPMLEEFIQSHKKYLIDSYNIQEIIVESVKVLQELPIITIPKSQVLYHGTSFIRGNKSLRKIFELDSKFYDIMSFSDAKNLENSNRDYFLGKQVTDVGRILVYKTNTQLKLFDISKSMKLRINLYEKISNIIMSKYKTILEPFKCKLPQLCGDGLEQRLVDAIILQCFNHPDIKGIHGLKVLDFRQVNYQKKFQFNPEVQLFTASQHEFPLTLKGVYINDNFFKNMDRYQKYMHEYLIFIRKLDSENIKVTRTYWENSKIVAITTK